jgi:hypothetical protein
MANKTSANQGSSGEQERETPRVSRKVIGKNSAPYERKAGAEGGEEKKPGSEGEQAAAGDPGAQAESKSAETASAEAAPDQGKSEAPRAATRKEAATRREARAQEPAPAAETAPASKPEPAPAAETTPAETTPAAPAPAAAQAAPASEPPPIPATDPAAEFELLLSPRQIERWDPATPAPAPLKAPPGDSRSFRRRSEGTEEFVLIYRVGSFLIKRAGRVGVMGTWTVTEYPHIGSAAHAYAQQCSDLTYAGFRDLR